MRLRKTQITNTMDKDIVLTVTVVAEPQEDAGFACQPITPELSKSICGPSMGLRQMKITSTAGADRVIVAEVVLGCGVNTESAKWFVTERLEKLLAGPELWDQGEPPVGMDPETGEVLDEETLKEVQELADSGVTIEMPGRTGRGKASKSHKEVPDAGAASE